MSSSLTPLIGRDPEVRSVLALLAAGTRLVTLTGVGGIGKTRLAREVVDRGADDFDRVFLVELSALTDPALVDRALLEALGLDVATMQQPRVAAADFLAQQRALVTIDNCEHLADAVAPLVDALLRECPRISVLATSRTTLSVEGETVWVVPPLSVAERAHGVSEAAELFLDRAEKARRTLARDAATRSAAERIVTALEGIPLAIELAAARTRVLTPHEVADALRDHLGLLRGGPRNAAARHRTMRASLDWSVQLLDDRDRFARLSIFAGGFTLDAARAVCGPDVLDAVDALIDASLLIAEPHGETTRYRMLDFVRQYAAELLTGEVRDDVAARHRAFFMAVAAAAEPERWSFSATDREALDLELPNLRAALEDATRSAPADALRMVDSLGPFWRVSGRITEGVAAIEDALAAAGETPSDLRAAALSMLSSLALRLGDIERCLTSAHAALTTADAVGADAQRANALSQLGIVTSLLDPLQAEEMLRQAAELAEECGDEVTTSDALIGLNAALCLRAAREEFWLVLPKALAAATSLEHASDVRWCCWAATVTATREGDLQKARAFSEHPVPAGEGDDPLLRTCLSAAAAQLEIASGNAQRGIAIAERELGVDRPDPAPMGTGRLRTALAFGALTLGDEDRARHLGEELLAPEQQAHALLMDGHEILMLVSLGDGDTATAREHAGALLEIAQAYGSAWGVAAATRGLARACLADGDAHDGERLAHEALALFAADGWRADAIDALELLGWASAVQDDEARAARYLAAAQAARTELGLARVPEEAAQWRARIDAARGSTEWEEGSRLNFDDALAYARRGRGARGRPAHGWESLTGVQRQIAELAAAGRSNPEIAAAVFVSRSTVKMHLSHVYAKLGVSSRVELAATAARRD